MSARLGLLPLAAILGAAAVAGLPSARSAPRVTTGFVDAEWTTRGFEDRLRSAAEGARAQLLGAPEIAWAEVRVRSVDDHAPLRVEADVAWARGAERVSADRKAVLLASLRSWFDAFADVDVVLPEPPAGERDR